MPTTIKHKTSPLSHSFHVLVNKTWGVGGHRGKGDFQGSQSQCSLFGDPWEGGFEPGWVQGGGACPLWCCPAVSSGQGMSWWIITTWKLLQNQPMLIIKTFPLQMLLALICSSFAVSKICLWLINALRNYLLLVFKEIQPAAHFKTLFLGLFARKGNLFSCAVPQVKDAQR